MGEIEIWKDVVGYEGLYQVSDLGRIKSLDRISYSGRRLSGKIKKCVSDSRRGYRKIKLSKNGECVTRTVHQLVAEAFLGFSRNDDNIVVDHLDNNPENNTLENLNIVTKRSNCYTHYEGTSKYKGVSWSKSRRKWMAQIYYDGVNHNLGGWKTEIEAHLVYESKLKQILK